VEQVRLHKFELRGGHATVDLDQIESIAYVPTGGGYYGTEVRMRSGRTWLLDSETGDGKAVGIWKEGSPDE
jgi:hypothetical protein